MPHLMLTDLQINRVNTHFFQLIFLLVFVPDENIMNNSVRLYIIQSYILSAKIQNSRVNLKKNRQPKVITWITVIFRMRRMNLWDYTLGEFHTEILVL
jgi:hypothetical protein